MKSRLAVAAVAAVLSLLAGGCARYPKSETGGSTSKLLVVTMTMRGAIQINRPGGGNFYYVLINRTDNASDPGPVPVIGLPWGNGFAAPSQPNGQGFVAIVRYNGHVSGLGGYDVNTPTDASGNLLDVTTFGPDTFPSIGPPDVATPVNPGDTTLGFQLDLGRLPQSVRNARYIQINMIATDKTPQGVSEVSKLWDALGDGTQSGYRNFFVTLDATQNQTLTNAQMQPGGPQEPSGDVFDRGSFAPIDDASLDIVDWTIQIRDK